MPSYVRGQGRRTLSDEEIIRLYLSGIDSDTIGYRANCSSTTVTNIVRAAGEAVRGRGTRPRKNLLIEDGEVLRRYRNGESGPTLAAAAGCTTAVIYRIIREAGGHVRASISQKGGRRSVKDGRNG